MYEGFQLASWVILILRRLSVVVHVFYPKCLRGRNKKIVSSRPDPAKVRRPYLKSKTKSKNTGGKSQVVEHLFRKHEALSSTLSTSNNNNNKCGLVRLGRGEKIFPAQGISTQYLCLRP
jgi:hypothetical protein